MKNKELPEYNPNTTSELYYDEKAKSYDTSHMKRIQTHMINFIFQKLLNKQNNTKTKNLFLNDKVILDIGIGTNIYNEIYQKNKCHVVGIDVSKEMLEMAQKNFIEENTQKFRTSINSTESIDKNNYTESIDKNNYTESEDKNNFIKNFNNVVSYLRIKNDLPFQPGSFDMILSISSFHYVLHDLYYNKNVNNSNLIKKNYIDYFNKLISISKKHCICIFQFYIKKDLEYKNILEVLNGVCSYLRINSKLFLCDVKNILNNKSINLNIVKNFSDIELSKNKKLFLCIWFDNRKFEEVIDIKNNNIEIIKLNNKVNKNKVNKNKSKNNAKIKKKLNKKFKR